MANDSITPKSASLRPARTCAACGVTAPQVRTLGTLAQHGWRLRVVPAVAAGSMPGTEYYCPECFARLNGSPPLHSR
jgi:hypothetical protein